MILPYVKRLAPRYPRLLLSRWNCVRPPQPVLVNFSVTNRCQSHCLTCNIWKLYRDNPEKEKEELTPEEIETIFRSMKPVILLNICGGEPFLRDDLPEICALGDKYLKPNVIHSPTNCLAPKKIESATVDILNGIRKTTQLTVKLSIDGIGEKHDLIRGTPGNFEKVRETYERLVRIRDRHPNFYLDAGVTVSTYNVDSLEEITDYVNQNWRLDNFLHEIADLRGELFNVDNPEIRPSGEIYAAAVNYLAAETRKQLKNKRFLSRMTQALRLVYYGRAAKVLKEAKRSIPCYAGISNVHINPWGGVWICNVQAFEKEMGNLRDFDYNFPALWYSSRAEEMRKWVREGHCYCPLVGQSFLDTLLNPISLLKTLRYYFL